MFANRAERPDPDRGIASFLYTLYRGGMSDPNEIIVDDGIKRTPAEDNPWYKFLLASIELDKGDDGARESKPYGWHWFWGIYGLCREIPAFPQCNIDVIKKQLPDNRCINFNPYEEERLSHPEGKYSSEMQQEATNALYKILQESNSLETVKEIDFSKLDFSKTAKFSKLIFPMDVSFEHAKFFGDASFYKAVFYKTAEFRKTIFCSRVAFVETHFCGNTNFLSTDFQGDVTFMKAIFAEIEITSINPVFNNTTFAGVTRFIETEFSEFAVFNNIKFFDKVYFSSATCSKIMTFDKTEFSKEARIHDVKFIGGAIFLNVIFFDHATFADGEFNVMMIFRGSVFYKEAKFDKVKITGHTNFRNAEFKQYPPSFHKADMYSNITWDDARWPIINKESDIDMVYQNKTAYENLASNMKKLDKYHDEHFFYRQEMRCRRWLTGYPAKFFYYFYEKLADYGYGIKQAFYWWLGHILAGIFFLMIIIRINIDGGQHKNLELAKGFGCSITTSFSNAHRFLSFHNGALSDCHNYLEKLYLFDVIWALQTIFGILFLFLFLLTVRIRFRLK